MVHVYISVKYKAYFTEQGGENVVTDIIETLEKLNVLQTERYWENVIFSYQWWILLIIFVSLWIIWFILFDWTRINFILLVGFLSSFLATLMDEVGISLSLWVYPYSLTPFTDRMNVVDLAIIPVFYMLLYQYARRWRSEDRRVG